MNIIDLKTQELNQLLKSYDKDDLSKENITNMDKYFDDLLENIKQIKEDIKWLRFESIKDNPRA